MELTFNGAVVISIPSLTLPLVDFVAQGTPIPAIEGTSADQPRTIQDGRDHLVERRDAAATAKRSCVKCCSTPLARRSMAMFSDTAAVTEERPAGLPNGIAALTPTAAVAGIKAEGMIDVEDQGGGKRWASSRSRRLRGEKEPQGSLTRAWGPEFSS